MSNDLFNEALAWHPEDIGGRGPDGKGFYCLVTTESTSEGQAVMVRSGLTYKEALKLREELGGKIWHKNYVVEGIVNA